MNSQQMRSGKSRKELQGPRPSPLKICGREPHKIGRPAPAVPSVPTINGSQPVIIYMQSPKIIHAEVQDFKTLVQRLTGSSSSSEIHSCGVKSENLAVHHSPIICQASDATITSSRRAKSQDLNMRSSEVHPTSLSITNIDWNQEIESWVSQAEATDLAQSAVTSSGGSSTILITP